MGRKDDRKIVEMAFIMAIAGDDNPYNGSPLSQMNDGEELLDEARKQLDFTRRLNNSIETSIRYHQGRALSILNRNQEQSTSRRYEQDIAQRTYQLFKDHEDLIPYFYEKPSRIGKLTKQEVREIRSFCEDPINIQLEELLDFEDVEKSGTDLFMEG